MAPVGAGVVGGVGVVLSVIGAALLPLVVSTGNSFLISQVCIYAVIALSLLASPIFFLLARLAHRLAVKHLGIAPPSTSFQSIGVDI